MAQPSRSTRVMARVVAVAGGVVGAVVLAGLVLADAVRGPDGPPSRNT